MSIFELLHALSSLILFTLADVFLTLTLPSLAAPHEETSKTDHVYESRKFWGAKGNEGCWSWNPHTMPTSFGATPLTRIAISQDGHRTTDAECLLVSTEMIDDPSPTRVPFNTPTKLRLTEPRAIPSSLLPADFQCELDADSDSFNISLVSDTGSSFDDSLRTIDNDDSLPRIEHSFSRTSSADKPALIGLGITGLCNKDGTAFDGTGIVGISDYGYSDLEELSNEYDNELNVTHPSTSPGRPSRTLIQEILLTFTSSSQRPCCSLYLDDDSLAVEDVFSNPQQRGDRQGSPSPTSSMRRRLTRDLSTSTISSQMKSTVKIDRALAPVWRS